MASIYQKKNSPFWYVHYIGKDGVRYNRSTGFRHDNANETREARSLRAKLESEELKAATRNVDGTPLDTLADKVIAMLMVPKTRQRYKGAWTNLQLFLTHQRIKAVQQIRYQTAIDYIDWRVQQKRHCGKLITKNTALFEIKVLGQIMQEAVRRGVINGNPLLKLGVKRDPAKIKPALTNDEIMDILQALKEHNMPKWMMRTFLISLHTGCRLSETQIHMRDVDFKNKKISFVSPKGGEARAFSAPIPDALLPLLTEIKQAGETYTLELPKMPSKEWWTFFERIKKSHLCFHCLRVTYVTRLAQAGVPLSLAMRLTNHSSELVHRIYQRLGVEDVRPYANVMAQSLAFDVAKG